MAKKFVKLGPKAEIFFDPNLRFKILKGEVAELPSGSNTSNKINKAIASGHLMVATEKEYSEYLAKAPKVSKTPKTTEVKNFDDSFYKEALAAKDREIEQLKIALKAKEKESGEFETDFDKMSEEELVEYYTENYEVSKKDLKEFGNLGMVEKVTYLKSLELEEEDEE